MDLNNQEIGIQCNWTRDLTRDFQKLVPPNYPFSIVNGEGKDKTVIFNGTFRPPKPDDILLTMEPACNRTHFSQVWARHPRTIQRNVIEWHLSTDWNTLLRDVPEKTNELSAIVSRENRLYGHQKRLELLSYIDDKLIYDLFGKHPHSLSNYKGPLNVKDSGLFPYRYHIAVENCAENGYFTEKIADAILAECLCFYWGCPDIDKYIDPRAYILLPIDKPEECLRIIQEAIASDQYTKRLPFIRNEKWRIMNSWSIFPTIERIIQNEEPPVDLDIWLLIENGADLFQATKNLVGFPYRICFEVPDNLPANAILTDGKAKMCLRDVLKRKENPPKISENPQKL